MPWGNELYLVTFKITWPRLNGLQYYWGQTANEFCYETGLSSFLNYSVVLTISCVHLWLNSTTFPNQDGNLGVLFLNTDVVFLQKVPKAKRNNTDTSVQTPSWYYGQWFWSLPAAHPCTFSLVYPPNYTVRHSFNTDTFQMSCCRMLQDTSEN